MIKKILFLALVAFGLFFTSCSNDDDNGGSSTKNITLNISGLEDLGSDYVYEGWIMVNSVPLSTGTFTDITSGQTFAIDTVQLNAATSFILTIEPSGETGTAADTPSDTKLLKGDFSGNSATVSIVTIGDFITTLPSGSFFLRSPTDETGGINNDNDENGIWFGMPAMPPTSGLILPTLEAGWKYEGWVIDGAGPLSTGTFTAFDVADDNAGATDSFSGTENSGPSIPGEDFFNNEPSGFTFPIDIRGKDVVISIEPSPDNSPNPFLLKPLKGTASNDTAPAVNDLVFDNTSFPTGTVTR